ncbi:MAG: alpha-glucosidase, partial [Tabrizicola sp.]
AQGSGLEHYRAALAFRKGSASLRTGGTRFLDLREPVLGFVRGEGEGALLCLFNLSPVARSLTVSGTSAPTGPSLHAVLQGDRLTLGPNAAAFLPVTGEISVQD